MWPFVFLTAAAAGWNLSPAERPVALGSGRYRYPGGHVIQTLPAVVLTLAPEHPPPDGARSLGGRSWLLPVQSPQDAIDTALLLQEQPGIEAAFPDLLLPRRPASFNDPSYPGQWYLTALEAERLYEISLGDAGTRVVVIDSGIDIDHPDLASATEAPLDAWSDDDDPRPDPGEFCYDGSNRICDDHGTAVSGVIVARADNNAGIVGLCPSCTLIPIKMLGEGLGAMSADIAAFEHAIAQDAAVINNSWGFTTAIPVPAPLASVIERAATEPRGGLGAVVVFAAGNDDRAIEDDELQALDSVLCVSATDSYGRPTAYTNEGAAVDIAAPSATVSIAPGDSITTTFGGTSAAAPVVSGVAAWLLSVRPELSADEVRDILLDAAVPSPLVTHDENGHHPIYGYGELSLDGVIDAVQTHSDTGEPVPAGCACTTQPTRAPRLHTLIVPLLLPLLVVMRRRIPRTGTNHLLPGYPEGARPDACKGGRCCN